MLMFIENLLGGGLVILVIIAVGVFAMIVRCYRKVDQGKALVRNGLGGTKVSFSGIVVLPIVHKSETMDISVKRVEIDRNGKNGLICMDNLRADIKVAFFVRVNQTPADVLKVAQAIGCERASSQEAMIELFDAKFSEALKTAGRQFVFVDLYNSREKLKEGILRLIGTDLNGFVLEDVAIDFLEQTPLAAPQSRQHSRRRGHQENHRVDRGAKDPRQQDRSREREDHNPAKCGDAGSHPGTEPPVGGSRPRNRNARSPPSRRGKVPRRRRPRKSSD